VNSYQCVHGSTLPHPESGFEAHEQAWKVGQGEPLEGHVCYVPSTPPDPRVQIGFNGLKSDPFVPFAVASVRFEQCPIGVVGFEKE
jgi:hypothetical protein